MSNQANYASVINDVIDNVIMVNPQRLPKAKEGETLISMSSLPDGAWIGWRLVEGVWTAPPQPPSYGAQAVEDAFKVFEDSIYDEEAKRISLIPPSSRSQRERDYAEAVESALETAIAEKKAMLDAIGKGQVPSTAPRWFNR